MWYIYTCHNGETIVSWNPRFDALDRYGNIFLGSSLVVSGGPGRRIEQVFERVMRVDRARFPLIVRAV